MNQVTVIGAGTMGNGIAHVFAQAGYPVVLCDVSAQALEKAMQTIGRNMDRMVEKGKITPEQRFESFSRIRIESSLKEAVKEADLVIEAATENEPLKLKIFAEIDQYAPTEAILATNTSAISITKIASSTKRPGQVIGMHFMNPVPIMKLVEIIRGYTTSDEVCARIMEISKHIGKIPVEVHDYPGFVANRLLMPMINEAIYTVFEGVGGVEEIDILMKLGMNHPMGPLQLADFIGLDVCLAILRVLQDGYGLAKYAPCPLLVNMVNAGKLGIKSGEGFYKYENGSKELVVADAFRKKLYT
ncbi:MAG: 3-hydroxybutyryl-CoA dehydrogenase [Bacteroidota bacterium]|nr:3-hydroxybutyryl-CoA dehydrogenase [Bacteroidota bacterium]